MLTQNLEHYLNNCYFAHKRFYAMGKNLAT